MTTRESASEASIFKGNDGRWHGWITVSTKPNGRPDRRHRTAKTRAEVVSKIRDLEERRETGTVGGPQPIATKDATTRNQDDLVTGSVP